MAEQVFCAFLGTSPREDFIPYVADFYLQLEDVKWTIVAGIVNDSLVMSVRNLGYSRNAGEFVRKYFDDIGSAGGHRAMAKAVVPLRAFREKFGNLQADEFTDKVLELALEFLHEHQTPEKKSSSKRSSAWGRCSQTTNHRDTETQRERADSLRAARRAGAGLRPALGGSGVGERETHLPLLEGLVFVDTASAQPREARPARRSALWLGVSVVRSQRSSLLQISAGT